MSPKITPEPARAAYAAPVRFTITGGPLRSTTDIWINRSTYLPVREKLVVPETSFNRRPTYTVTNDFTWLPRTSANLAQLAGG